MKIPSLKIRQARPEDASAIAEVHVRSWQETYPGLVPDSLLLSLANDFDRLTEAWRKTADTKDERSSLLVASVENQVVGFANTAPSGDPDLDSGEVGELRVIYLRSAFWGKGIGKALHDHALTRLRSHGFEEAMLWVLDTNERTRMWYERQGWRTDGATKSDNRGDFVLKEVRYRIKLQDSS